jgi:tetratricopeptide (TPR) repeat protein
MAKEPADRYRTASELAEDLRRYLADRPILARRPSLLDRATKWARRRPGIAAAAVAMLVLAVVGLLISNALIARERNRAVLLRRQAQERARWVLLEVSKINDEVATAYLLRNLRLEQWQRKFIERVLYIVEKYVQENGNDSDSQYDTAVVCLRLGRIQNYLGRTQVAEAHYRRALPLWDSLVREFPDNPDCLVSQAGCLVNIGHIVYARNPRDAEQYYRRALVLTERLASRFPDYPHGLQQLADCLIHCGRVLLSANPPEQAEVHFRRALPILVRLTALPLEEAGPQAAGPPMLKNLLSVTLSFLESILTASGRRNEIDRVYGDALTLSESLGPILIEVRPILQSGWALSLVTRPEVQSRDLRKALELARRAVELTSQSDAQAWLTLGFVMAQAGDQQVSDEAIRPGIGLGGDNAVEMGRWWDQAVAALTRALELKLDTPRLRLARGRAFARLGQTQQAEADFAEAVKLTEKDRGSGHQQRLLAFALERESGQLPKAEAVLREAVKTWEQLVAEQPRDVEGLHYLADTHGRLARVLNARGQRDAALAEYREAIRLHGEHLARVPDSTYGVGERAAAYLEYALLLLRVGRVAEARVHYEKAVAILPEALVDYNAKLAATKIDPGLHDRARALERLPKFVELDSNAGPSWKTLGSLLYRAGDWSGAIEALRMSNERGEKGALGFNGYFLAMAHYLRGESGPARIWFEVARRWHTRAAPKDEALNGLRSEAAELLAVTVGASAGARPAPADDATLGRLVLQADPAAVWARAWLGKADPGCDPTAGPTRAAPMPNGLEAFAPE